MEYLKRFYSFDPLTSDTIIGHCYLCGSQYSDKIGSTGNFHKHLRRKHKKEYGEERRGGSSRAPSDIECGNDQRDGSIEIKINESIASNLVVKCNLPPSTIEQSGFRSFMKCVASKWKPISSRYMKTKLIPTLFSSVRQRIETMLNEIEHLSVTTDIWTDRRGKSFIGITGHFLNADFKPQAVLLDFVRLKGRHTGENIRYVTEGILESLNISRKVYRLITDNASNMLKAYKFGLTVASDELQDQLKDDDCDDNSSDTDYPCDDDLHSQDPLILTDPIDDENDDFDQEINKHFRLLCFAHSLQLAIRDGLTDVPILSKTLAKCNKLSMKSHKSTKIADLLDDTNMRLKRSNTTRWNSEYLLVKSILQLGQKTIGEITTALGNNDLKFVNNDFNVLEELIEILEPFAEITIKCQSEVAASVSIVVPSIVHVLHHLEQMKTKSLLLQKLICQLTRSINVRFSGIVKRLLMQPVKDSDPFNDPIYFIAAVLDPKFRFRWLRLLGLSQAKETKLKQALIDLILNECELNEDASIDQSSSSSSTANTYSTSTNESSNLKKRKLFDYDDDDKRSVSSELSPSEELTEYIDGTNRMNSLECWKSTSLTSMRSVVKRVFSVQASSAPIERAFSQSGLIMSPRRAAMKDGLFQSLVFLRVNKHLL